MKRTADSAAWSAFAFETRAQTIVRYTQDYMRSTGTKTTALAADIAHSYQAFVPAMLRHINFHKTRDTYADMRANAQIIRRFMEGDNRLPAELEEAWVNSLPEPWRVRLTAELAKRYGLLAVSMPVGANSHTGDLAKLMRETGEACAVTALMLANGHFGPEDMPFYKKAIAELDDVLVAVMELKNRITTEVAGKDCVKQCCGSTSSVTKH